MVLVTVSVAVAVLVGYQFHTAAHEPMQAFPAMHHDACAFHLTSHVCSLMAILPRGLASALVALCIPYALALGVPLQGFTCPPFIPPKALLRLSRV
ncbi:MAG TPA: hypothetical protein VI542_03755 [Candidatus Tectomicrobia bacterium]